MNTKAKPTPGAIRAAMKLYYKEYEGSADPLKDIEEAANIIDDETDLADLLKAAKEVVDFPSVGVPDGMVKSLRNLCTAIAKTETP